MSLPIPEKELKDLMARHGISPEEQEVLLMAFKGDTPDQIAEHLGLSSIAIRKRLGKVFTKFGIEGRIPNKLEILKMELKSQYVSSNLNRSDSFSAYSTALIKNDIEIINYWGDSAKLEKFYGRGDELKQLNQWAVEDNCQLITVLGMVGIGKTTLVKEFARQMRDDNKFQAYVWYSLQNPPVFHQFLEDLLKHLSKQVNEKVITDADDLLAILMNWLVRHRYLLILDGIDNLLSKSENNQEESLAGTYAERHREYAEFIYRLGEEKHNSCIILTSREKPVEIGILEAEPSRAQSLLLEGLEPKDCKKILREKGLEEMKEDKSWDLLSKFYGCNPLFLKIVAPIIKNQFMGNVGDFVNLSLSSKFRELRMLLAQQLDHLTTLEEYVIYWLAINDNSAPNIHNNTPISLTSLSDSVSTMFSVSVSDLIEAFDSLYKRSLLERKETGFTLPGVVKEYVTNLLVERICFEIEKFDTDEAKLENELKKLEYLRNYPLDGAGSSKESILSSLSKKLRKTFGASVELENKLKQMLNGLKECSDEQTGSAASNLKHLLDLLENQ